MLTKTEKQFSILFVFIVIIELITGSSDALQGLHYLAKPAIVISLIVLFLTTSQRLPKAIRTITFLALGFSVLGDILLMFVHKSEHFFTLGLVAFLLAHVMYIIVFLKQRNKNRSAYGFVLVLLVYAASLFYFLYGNLGYMLFPVVIYMLVILGMATAAYLRKDSVNIVSYGLVLVGAILFVISDSILALNKFYERLAYSNISIMITYAFAQYFIVIGILKLKLE